MSAYDQMVPTAQLRFIERIVTKHKPFTLDTPMGQSLAYRGNAKILQQWWHLQFAANNSATGMGGEWRDVPLVDASATKGDEG